MTDRADELHWDPEQIRRRGHEAIDWVVDYLSGIEKRPVLSRTKPGEVATSLPMHPPAAGESFDEVLADLDSVVMPGITHWQHPSWFAFFNSNTSGPSMVADIISSGLAVQGMLWQTSPACTSKAPSRQRRPVVEVRHMYDRRLDRVRCRAHAAARRGGAGASRGGGGTATAWGRGIS